MRTESQLFLYVFVGFEKDWWLNKTTNVQGGKTSNVIRDTVNTYFGKSKAFRFRKLAKY